MEVMGLREIMMFSPNSDAPQNPGASLHTQAAGARESGECVNALRFSLHTDTAGLALPSLTNGALLGI